MSNSAQGHPSQGSGPGQYTIRVKGLLDPRWADWFNGLTVTPVGTSETVLSGRIADQAALHGLLERIRDLNLTLVSVTRAPTEPGNGEDDGD